MPNAKNSLKDPVNGKRQQTLRLTSGPLVHDAMDPSLGGNINGPSLIRVPQWVTRPLGRYYLYFAHHSGRFIRLAFSDDLPGPWTIYRPGVLDVADTGFATSDLPPKGAEHFPAHIASPDVHVDHDRQTISMYFHGMDENGEQYTRLATSRNGLDFDQISDSLGPSYFRVFRYGEYIYAIALHGDLLRARHPDGPFESGPSIFKHSSLSSPEKYIRHVAVKRTGDHLDLFYSRIGDCPEVICHAPVALTPDWHHWEVGEPTLVLKPELTWEGADEPVIPSRVGEVRGMVHALRDPAIFEEEGRRYLLYSGAGESALGIAEILD